MSFRREPKTIPEQIADIYEILRRRNVTVSATTGEIAVTNGGPPGATGPAGATGSIGPTGPAGVGEIEIWDQATPPPLLSHMPYIRFERDIDGDVQYIYLGTAS